MSVFGVVLFALLRTTLKARYFFFSRHGASGFLCVLQIVSFYLTFPSLWISLVDAAVMILRLWALYNQSRLILGTLLTFFAMQIVAYFVAYVMFSAKFPSDIQGKFNDVVLWITG